MTDINWSEAVAIGTLIIAIGGVLLAGLRARFTNVFATRVEHTELADRVDDIEQRIAAMPSHADIVHLTAGIAQVSREVAVAGASIGGLKDGLGRVEHMLSMLVKSQLDREAKP